MKSWGLVWSRLVRWVWMVASINSIISRFTYTISLFYKQFRLNFTNKNLQYFGDKFRKKTVHIKCVEVRIMLG